MAPATRKSKRAAAVAAAKPEEEPALPDEAEERAPKKKKEDPQTETEPSSPLRTEQAQTEQKQALDESTDAVADLTDVAALNVDEETVEGIEDEETEEHIAEGNEGDGEGNGLAVGDGGEQEEERVDKEEVEEAEEVEEDCDRIQLDVLGDTGDDGIDDEDVEEPRGTQEPDENQGDDVTAANGVGATKTATYARREDEAFPSQGKLFIGGLTWETTADTLQSHFGKYGEITDSVVMKNRNTGHPRGFGFVTFADPSVCDNVLKDTHVIDGRTVEAKQTVPREKGPTSSKSPKSKKIFVGGLTTTTTEEELKVYFEKFGKVVEHQIMQDHKTGRSRGFGFVTFDSEEVVDNILSQGRLLELGGKQVEVKRAEPKRAGQESFAGSSNSGRPFTSRGGSFGGGYGSYDPYFARGGSHNNRGGGGRAGAPAYGGDAYRYGGGYGGVYAYGGLDDGYAGLGLNYPSFGSGPGYGYNYGGNARGYGGNGGRYHPYGR